MKIKARIENSRSSTSTTHSKYSVPGLTPQRPHLKRPITRRHVWIFIRRVLTLIAAIVYTNNSLQGGLNAITLLQGTFGDIRDFELYQADYITSFAQPLKVHDGDTSTVGNGKLVNQILKDTTPLNQTLYLHSVNEASFQDCRNWTTEATQRMYSNAFLRKLYSEVFRDTANVVPEFVGTEMVVPIVDCSFTPLRKGDKSDMRAFYLMRKANSFSPNDTFLTTLSFSMQDYDFPEVHQVGPTGMLVLSIVTDFSSDNVVNYYALTPGYPFHSSSFTVFQKIGMDNDGDMELESVPTPATASDPTKVYQTSKRSGTYRNTESDQAHIKKMHWEPSKAPAMALSSWQWRGRLLRCDSWAWVHGIHFLFAAQTLFNLIVLLLVIYRNILKRKIWIGDAFVSISKSTILRTLLVILSSALNGFWTARKFMIEEGNILGNLEILSIDPQVMHADLMLIYLGIVDLIGFVMCERVDPALAMFLFEIGFATRRSLAQLFPAMVNSIVEFARNENALGTMYVHPKLMSISPLRFTTSHELSSIEFRVAINAVFPVFSTLIFLIAYIPLRKLYRHYLPDRMVQYSRPSGPSNTSSPSTETEEILSWKSSLTMFEVATGSALQSRVGLVSDYNNCIYIKGMKFASADGVYCNGFVVASNKYLVRTSDLWLIYLMVITRIRFWDLYVYEVDGYTVQKTARLFYPEMMSLSDLFNLHSTMLS